MLDRRSLLGALMGAGVTAAPGCAALRARDDGASQFARPAPLVPLRIDEDRLMKITVCLRPFRAAGPRLEAERAGDKLVIHNYGHGGSGWSLSWGCAEDVAALASEAAPSSVAVIGAGVMGLTSARRLIERGVPVTIYAEEFPAQTRSARATGSWSPDSRIALAGAVDDAFAARWERWARRAYATHLEYVGQPGEPVEFLRRFGLSDGAGPTRASATRDFLDLNGRVRDLTARWRTLDADAHPFPVARARSGVAMNFNVASYAQTLTRDFLARGGRMIRRSFGAREACLALPEPVIVNCAGYGSKSLWGDDGLSPVRGQINWLTPQRDAQYGLYYRNVVAISRRDGVVIQELGDNDDFGFGVESETPDPEEFRRAVAKLAPLFPA